MRKYYYKDATGQHGPLSLEKLKGKGITAETPVWYDPLPQWTTAGQEDELKSIIARTTAVVESATPVVEMKEQAKQPEPVVTETPVVEMPKVEKPVEETPVSVKLVTPAFFATASTATVVARPVKKTNTAWLSWALLLLVLGGIGYFIYQDMEKNKNPTTDETELNMMNESSFDSSNAAVATINAPDTQTSLTVMRESTADSSVAPMLTTETPVTTTTTNSATTSKTIIAQDAKKKAEAEKKKQQVLQANLVKQKAEEEKKQQLAAQAALAKELQVRNNWSRYITTGSLNYKPKGDDGITAFDVPVYNATDALLNKVTVRVDYYKKEGKEKVQHSETIVIYNIPPKSGLNGNAPEYKKARKAVVTITGVTSRKLHFCYPQNNGNNADPYYCN